MAALAIAVRLVLLVIYSPWYENDSSSYTSLARQILHLRFTGYEGLRTPGYPLFLLLGGVNGRAVWVWQTALGIATCLLLYRLVWDLTRNARVALTAGIAFTLSLNVLFFEGAILTETLTMFVFLAAFCLFARIAAGASGTRARLGLGLWLAVLALVRPEYFVFAPFWAVAGWVTVDRPLRSDARASRANAVAVLGPTVVVALALSVINVVGIDYFGPTTLTGYNLTDHVGSVVHLAPQKYATVRDIYVRARAAQLARTGHDDNVIWQSVDRMRRTTGLSFPALSKRLTAMSVGLIAAHPLSYVKSVARVYPHFWDAPIYWKVSSIHPVPARTTLRMAWKLERVVLVALNVLFFGVAVRQMVAVLRRRRGPASWQQRVLWTAIAAVLVGSVPEALLAYGENGRYAFPYTPLIFVATAVGLLWWRSGQPAAGDGPIMAAAARRDPGTNGLLPGSAPEEPSG